MFRWDTLRVSHRVFFPFAKRRRCAAQGAEGAEAGPRRAAAAAAASTAPESADARGGGCGGGERRRGKHKYFIYKCNKIICSCT